MKYVKDNWLKTREVLFLTLLAVEIFLSLLFKTTFNLKTSLGYFLSSLQLFYIPVIVGALYAADMCITGIKSNIKKILLDGFIGVFFVIAAYTSLEFNLIATGIFLVSSHMSSVKNIAKTIAVTLLFGTVLFGVFSQIGIIEDRLDDYYRFGKTAHALGFRRYGFPARQLVYIICTYICFKDKKMSWAEILLCAVACFAVFDITTHRLSFIISMMIIVLYVVIIKYEIIKINNIFVKSCSLIGFTTVGIFSVITAYFYEKMPAIIYKINGIISGRIYMGYEAFNRYDVNLLGQQISTDSTPEFGVFFYIDNGYLDALFKYGIVLFIIVTIIYTFIHWYSCRTNNKGLFIWATAAMVYNFIDNAWLDMIATGVTIIVFGAILNELRKDKNSNLKAEKKDLLE